ADPTASRPSQARQGKARMGAHRPGLQNDIQTGSARSPVGRHWLIEAAARSGLSLHPFSSPLRASVLVDLRGHQKRPSSCYIASTRPSSVVSPSLVLDLAITSFSRTTIFMTVARWSSTSARYA